MVITSNTQKVRRVVVSYYIPNENGEALQICTYNWDVISDNVFKREKCQ